MDLAINRCLLAIHLIDSCFSEKMVEKSPKYADKVRC